MDIRPIFDKITQPTKYVSQIKNQMKRQIHDYHLFAREVDG